MKHPGPWKIIVDEDDGRAVTIEDANGRWLICPSVSADSPTIATPEAERLILAAPELLEELRAMTCGGHPYSASQSMVDRARALIERIEKGST